ncbi:hypothetical protein BDK89_0517 [Ilumatobacter fluminis]|uniref:SnoaL-like protein n=1 Tax=Ilumatobacter fluminis TaxID=467091 RepID=A0A4V3EIL5_9ACTN|nr:hypothetical protein [Ilumatobacter fluminis]TDT14958.1 hypothetical protein BDK89_0517 [Ilumatobacter fluminis]
MSIDLDRLRAELHASHELGDRRRYGELMAEHWGPSVTVMHEPANPNDKSLTVDEMLEARRRTEERMKTNMPDARYVRIYSRVIANVIYLMFDRVGTSSDGDEVVTPICTRITIEDDRISQVVFNIAPDN